MNGLRRCACRKLKLDPCLSPYTSINSKWINDFNIRLETLKLIKERARHSLEATDIGKDFLQQLSTKKEKGWTNGTT
jgi:hypothetical protein